MDNINWLHILFGFLSGGAFGALIKQGFENRRNRIQPIGHSIELDSQFVSFENELINSQVILTDTTGKYTFNRLYSGKLRIINTGSLDFPEFNFGLTLNDTQDFIQIKANSEDRHHNVEVVKKPELSEQINTVDIKLKPFNRKDSYDFDFLITSDSVNVSAEDLKISSPHPIKWIGIAKTSDLLLELAKQTVLKIGPLSVNLNKM